MGLVDYHIHTPLCGHATGSPDDYIRRAEELKLQEIGFSDHAPLPEELREGITMAPGQVEEYIGLIGDMKHAWAGRIAVRLGFEIDYPFHDSFDVKYLADARLDYFIGSCHFLNGWAFDHPAYIEEFGRRDINEVYAAYYSLLEGLVLSGAFQILGHFDLVKKFGHRAVRDFRGIVARLARIIARRDMAVEINTAGFRKPVGEAYPADDIIAVLFDNNVPLVLGSDSHEPGEVGHRFPEVVETIKRIGYRKLSGFSAKKRFDINL